MGRGGRGNGDVKTALSQSLRAFNASRRLPINLFVVSPTLCGAPSPSGYSNGMS